MGGRGFAGATAAQLRPRANVHLAPPKGAGGQYHRAGTKFSAFQGFDTHYPRVPVVKNESGHHPLDRG